MVELNERDSRDAAFAEEAAKLADVVQHIEAERLRLEGQMPATAALQEAADAIQQILQANADSFYSAIDQPYFGRLDYFHKDDEQANATDEPPEDGTPLPPPPPSPPRTIYLGIVFIRGKDVYSWTSPVGKLWYTQSYEDGYTAPRGYIATRVDLKRYIRIRSRELEGVTDIFRRQLPAPSTARREILAEAVSGVGSGDGHLQVIVETIEPDQYENIANVSDRVLIVQGAAGSGKSEIGLHRIAFLLSPFSDIAESERPTPSTTLFVGPSQAFLEYAADILPSLGVHEGVDRVRFSEWLGRQLSVSTPVRARAWSDLLARGEMTRFDEAAETFKGSLAMADAIEGYVAEKAREIRRGCLSLPDEIDGPDARLEVSSGLIRSTLNAALQPADRGQGLNRSRVRFIDRIVGSIQASDPVRSGRRSQDSSRSNRTVGRLKDAGPGCAKLWRVGATRRGLISTSVKSTSPCFPTRRG